MRKTILLATILSFLVTGCGDKETKQKKPAPPTAVLSNQSKVEAPENIGTGADSDTVGDSEEKVDTPANIQPGKNLPEYEESKHPFEIAAFQPGTRKNNPGVGHVPFTMDRKGHWFVEVDWSESQTLLVVSLDGAGQIGTYASYEAKPPVRFHVIATPAILRRGRDWEVIVQNKHPFPIHGIMTVRRPVIRK